MKQSSKNNFEELIDEKERIGKLAQIRELIFGAQDGLLGTLALISTISGAINNTHIILITGLSACLAGAFSMFTGSYIASKSERDLYKSEIKKEKSELRTHKQEKKDEMIVLLEEEGLSHQSATEATDEISKSDEALLNTLVQKELGIEPDPEEFPLRDGLYAGGAFTATSLIPVLPYFFFSRNESLPISIILTLFSLFCIGIYKGRITSTPFFKSGLEILIIGIASGIGGYILGHLLPHIINIG